MCGLFGHFSISPLWDTTRLVDIGHSQQERGNHAHGIAFVTHDGEIAHMKRAGAIKDSDTVQRGSGSIALIGHTRWATHGSVANNANNHPHRFVYRGNPCYLVHNGIIPNYEDIAKQRGLTLRTECDSEVLARHIESSKGGIINRVVAAIKDICIHAPFAAAFLTPDALILARRGNPLYWSDDEDGVRYFASTRTALRGTVYTVPNNRVFMIPFVHGTHTTIRKLPKRVEAPTPQRWLGSDYFGPSRWRGYAADRCTPTDADGTNPERKDDDDIVRFPWESA